VAENSIPQLQYLLLNLRVRFKTSRATETGGDGR
jgi:hypothetical protein